MVLLISEKKLEKNFGLRIDIFRNIREILEEVKKYRSENNISMFFHLKIISDIDFCLDFGKTRSQIITN